MDDDKKLDALCKSEEKNTKFNLSASTKFSTCQNKIKIICQTLNVEPQIYDKKKTINLIKEYLKSDGKIERILYSEISTFIFNLDENQRGNFASNIERLFLYAIDDENDLGQDIVKIIIKVYDHFHLVLYQIGNAENIYANNVDEVKRNLQEEVNNVEKQYITILGIFAAIVLAFVGEITFSSSVLQNISNVSIYRLILIVDILAFVVTNTIYLLLDFIFKINGKDIKDKGKEIIDKRGKLKIKLERIKKLDYIYLIIAGITIICWILNAHELAGFISDKLPWCT